MNQNSKQRLIVVCECAMMIAISVILSFFDLSLWANGGSADLVMVPLLVLAFRRGAGWAIPSGLIFGFIKCTIGRGLSYGIISILLDYVLAYGMVGIAGFFRKMKGGIFLGTAVACVARFLVHFTAGVTIWRLAVGDSVELFGSSFSGDTAVLYSLLYNGSYMLVNTVAALVVMALLKKPLAKAMAAK